MGYSILISAEGLGCVTHKKVCDFLICFLRFPWGFKRGKNENHNFVRFFFCFQPEFGGSAGRSIGGD
jgi:hypothetical protein